MGNINKEICSTIVGTRDKVQIVLKLVGVENELHEDIFKKLFVVVGKNYAGDEIYETFVTFLKLHMVSPLINLDGLNDRYKIRKSASHKAGCLEIMETIDRFLIKPSLIQRNT